MKKAIKASKNACCKARLEADMERVAVSAATGIEVNRLAKIELDTKIPYPEEIVLMSDLYKAPELENWYCSKMCPIGKRCCSLLKDNEFSKLERNILMLSRNSKKVPQLVDTLTDMAYDGVIDKNEGMIMKNEIKKDLTEMLKTVEQVLLWIDKNVGDIDWSNLRRI